MPEESAFSWPLEWNRIIAFTPNGIQHCLFTNLLAVQRFNLAHEFRGEIIHPQRKVANAMEINIIGDNRRDGREKSRSGGNQSIRNSGRHRLQAEACPTSLRPANASITPHTVPNNPMKVEIEPIVASHGIQLSM